MRLQAVAQIGAPCIFQSTYIFVNVNTWSFLKNYYILMPFLMR